MFIKALIFISTFILVSCSAPPPITPIGGKRDLSSEEPISSDEKFTDWDSSREYFHYQLTDCTGEQKDHFNGKTHDDFLDIAIEDGEAELFRSSMVASLNKGLTGDWDHSSGQLTNISGKFGISTIEDWSLASGHLHISNEGIVGKISGIKIEYVGSNKNGPIDVSCSVILNIEKKKE